MIRTLGGIAGGVAIAILLVMFIESVGLRLAWQRSTVELAGGEGRAPIGTLIFPILGWFVGTFVGGMAAVWFSARNWTAWVVAAAVLMGVLLRITLAGHPVWAMILGALAPVIGALLAQRFAPRRKVGTD
jgi:hypothetical protein